MDSQQDNGEIFHGDSKGWKEEAEAVIKDVRDHVKDIHIAQKQLVEVKTRLKILSVLAFYLQY
jgi:hypothetical protein